MLVQEILFCLSLNLLSSLLFLFLSHSSVNSLSPSQKTDSEARHICHGPWGPQSINHKNKETFGLNPPSLPFSLSFSYVFTQEYGINKIEVIESCFVSLQARIYSIWLNFRKLFFQHKEQRTSNFH